MADVEMSDAPGTVSKKVDSTVSKNTDEKKKFEVKKVGQRRRPSTLIIVFQLREFVLTLGSGTL